MAVLLRRRNLASIPGDQQKLLDRRDSWAAHVSGEHDAHARVPAHVLETLKQVHRARLGDGDGDGAANADLDKSRDPPAAADDADDARSHGGSARAPSTPRGSPHPSSPERELSWTPSPVRDQSLLHQPIESSVVRETTIPPAPRVTGRRSSPPQPPRNRAPEDGHSSGSEEPDLETELPLAQMEAGVSVNRMAARPVPEATPFQTDDTPAVDSSIPCAQPSQPVIPGTVSRDAKPSTPPQAAGRQHRYKAIDLSGSPVRMAAATAGSKRMATTKVFADPSSSCGTSSSSLVPATACPGSSAADHHHVVASAETAARLAAAPPVPAHEEASQREGVAATESIRSSAVVEHPRPAPADAPARSNHLRQPDPYEAFVTAYPDYATSHGGSVWNFVKACVCLDYLRRERLLRECLYDEFVRAFSAQPARRSTTAWS
ncbi:hypothetical protein CDD83_9894 [Cordyceps sp. RAO-2017]|nr:hypothetical protein CDD83_9894 [Cordyceps sp. RAO-2017]